MNPYAQQRRFAPQVRRPGMGDVTPQAVAPAPAEDEQLIPVQRVLAADERALDVGVNIDKDADFWLTHIWGTSTGLYTIILRHHNGRPLMPTAIRSDNFVGTVRFKTPIKPMYFPAGSRISVDLFDVTSAPNTVELIFGGIRRAISY